MILGEHYWKLYTGQLILIDENVKRKILIGTTVAL